MELSYLFKICVITTVVVELAVKGVAEAAMTTAAILMYTAWSIWGEWNRRTIQE
jgi:hypothetical protein